MRTSRDERECVGIFGKGLGERERRVTVDRASWHKLFHCFHLTIRIRAKGKERGKIKNEKQKRGLWKITEERFFRSFFV